MIGRPLKKRIERLIDRGYAEQDINVLMSEETRDKYYKDGDSEVGNKALEGTGVGAMVGGTLGAVIGGVAAIGSSLVIPGIGLVIAGPIVAALAGAGAGSLAGGLTGALIGWGIPEEQGDPLRKRDSRGRNGFGCHAEIGGGRRVPGERMANQIQRRTCLSVISQIHRTKELRRQRAEFFVHKYRPRAL